jgi:hypothetical protein
MFLYSSIKWIMLTVAVLFGGVAIIMILRIKQAGGIKKIILFGITSLLILIVISLLASFVRAMWFPSPLNSEYVNPIGTNASLAFSDLTLIAASDNICRQRLEPFVIMLSFVNFTNAKIKLADEFILAKNRIGNGGNISVILRTIQGEDLYTIWDNRIVDYFPPPSKNFVLIPANYSLDIAIEYYFPKEFLKTWPSNEEIIVTPMPDSYMLSFVYSQYQGNTDMWNGTLVSNEITICLID